MSDGDIVVSKISNGRIAPSSFPFLYENLGHPRLRELRSSENLDQVVAGGRTEFEKIVLLRTWARSQWDNLDRKGQIEPYWDAVHILKGIREGSMQGGICSEFSAVLMQACLSMGFQARIVSIESKEGAGHRVVEVWSDDFDKWVLMDPLLDLHYESDGVPLNALELHSAMFGGRISDIALAQGGTPGAIPDRNNLIANYFHVTVFLRNNYLSLYDRVLNSYALSFQDAHTDGRPDFSRFITTRAQDLYWPLNQTVMEIRDKKPRDARIRIALTTNTPEFESFEARFNDKTIWQTVDNDFVWKLDRGENMLSARARNILGVAGPAATLKVRSVEGG